MGRKYSTPLVHEETRICPSSIVSKWQKSNEAITRLVGSATAAKLKVFVNYLLSLLQESKMNPNLDEILKLIIQ